MKIVNTGEVTSMSLRGGDGSLFFLDVTAVMKIKCVCVIAHVIICALENYSYFLSPLS